MKTNKGIGKILTAYSKYAMQSTISERKNLVFNPSTLAELNLLAEICQKTILNKTPALLGAELPVVGFRQIRYFDGKRSRALHDTKSLTKGITVLRTAPGANTPTCTEKDLEDLVNNLPKYKEAGVDNVALLLTADSIDTNYKWVKEPLFKAKWLDENSKNDPDFVAKHLTIITDQSKYLANNILGLLFHSEELGFVPKRAAAIFQDGKIIDIVCQEKASEYDLVLVDSVLERLAKLKTKPTAKL